MSKPALPLDYPRIRTVRSFDELASTPFRDGVNALCWERPLCEGFDEILAQVAAATGEDGIVGLDADWLEALSVSSLGRKAIDLALADLRMLEDCGLDPKLDCIFRYRRDENAGSLPRDVLSFHADSATEETDTWLCTYAGPASEGLRNDQAVRRIDLPEFRSELLRRFGGADDDEFLEYLSEHCHDLHYVPKPGAEPFSFGRCQLWRIATEYPGSPVPPCIHRAPATALGDPPRLLLIS
jgi:hypothetical protein